MMKRETGAESLAMLEPERTELLANGESIGLYDRPLPWQVLGLTYTTSGYGARIPTRYVVSFKGRVRRVYCTIYSNFGTCWFTCQGTRWIVG